MDQITTKPSPLGFNDNIYHEGTISINLFLILTSMLILLSHYIVKVKKYAKTRN